MDYGIFKKYVSKVKANGFKTKIIENDLTESDGALIFDGNVIVKGKISTNAVIEATGDVITPCIEFAQVYTKGIFYADLITGAGNEKFAIIRAKEGVVAGLIQYSNIISYKDINVSKEVRDSDIFAESMVNIIDDNGGIVGGTVSGYAGVNSGFIGANNSKETKIIVGYSRRLVSELEKSKKNIEELTRKLDSCKLYVDKLEKGGDSEKLTELKEHYESLKSNYEFTSTKIKELEITLKIDILPEVRFTSTVYSGSKIAIGKSAILMDENLTGAGKFQIEDKVIKIIQ